MRLYIGFLDDVQPELIAQVQKNRIVRIMRGPHGVEPELLHEAEVLAHVVGADHAASVLVEVVAVDAAQQHRPAIDQQLEPVDNHPPEPDLQLSLLDNFPGGAAKHDLQRVQVRLLRGPAPDLSNMHPRKDDQAFRRRRATLAQPLAMLHLTRVHRHAGRLPFQQVTVLGSYV